MAATATDRYSSFVK